MLKISAGWRSYQSNLQVASGTWTMSPRDDVSGQRFTYAWRLMVQKSHSQPPGMVLKPVVNNGINHQPQLVNAGFLNHQQYHQWLEYLKWYHMYALTSTIHCSFHLGIFGFLSRTKSPKVCSSTQTTANWTKQTNTNKYTHKNWKWPSTRNLVGGWTNPFEKYARQIWSFPQFSGWK